MPSLRAGVVKLATTVSARRKRKGGDNNDEHHREQRDRRQQNGSHRIDSTPRPPNCSPICTGTAGPGARAARSGRSVVGGAQRPGPRFEHARRTEDARGLADREGDRRPLRRVLDGLGSHVIANDPQLALVSAITSLEAGEVVAENDLRDAYESWPVHRTADLVILRRLVEQLVAVSVGQAAALSDVGGGRWGGPSTRAWEALMRLSRVPPTCSSAVIPTPLGRNWPSR
jgi:hypothetical protein